MEWRTEQGVRNILIDLGLSEELVESETQKALAWLEKKPSISKRGFKEAAYFGYF